MNIPFNKPYESGNELCYIKDAISRGHISGDGFYTKSCNKFIEEQTGALKALIVHSGTAALEMAAILINTTLGDEIIMPSFTFVSTANAFVLRGAKPVFVDIRPDTQNIDETKIEAAITPRTKAIVVVHYAGVACEMDTIMDIAHRHNLIVIEDAAQAVGSTYKGKALGSIGQLGCYSFHETKNVISGEGGAILINDPEYVERAEIIREKGTNRSKFFRGQVDKYTWVDIGSSYLPGDMIAAYLYAQLENIEAINAHRMQIWQKYHDFFAPYEQSGKIKRPTVPANCTHNAHMYYVLFNTIEERTQVINALKEQQITSVFHYIPLHSSPAGEQFGLTPTSMPVTDKTSDTLLRFPMFHGLNIDLVLKTLSIIMNQQS
ncbi:MAG: dTDP-4-amino-4,6-dideoxygalactose transaminase [Akkermansia sp.]